MPHCFKCGEEIPEGALFCNHCGVRQELLCAGCGAKLPEGSRFCHMCGKPVEEDNNKKESKTKTAADLFKAGFRFPVEGEEENVDDDDVFHVKEEYLPKQEKTPSTTDLSDRPEQVPTAERVKERTCSIFGNSSSIRYDERKNTCELDIMLRFNDDDMEDTDPNDHIYGDGRALYMKKDVGAPLEHLNAWLAVDKGFYYAKGDMVYAMSAETGKVVMYGSIPHVFMIVELKGQVHAFRFKGLNKIVSNEHRDTCGYMYEEWHDVYQVFFEDRVLKPIQ